MHFWIDKRSQSCGFGRARVSASLSGSGIGFGHHPRRIGGKSMVTPIHRFPAVDFRPHPNRASSITTTPSVTHSHHPPLPITQTNPQSMHQHHLQSHLSSHGQQHQPLFHQHVSHQSTSQHVQHHQPHMFSHHMLQRPNQQNARSHQQYHQQQTQHQPQTQATLQPECHVPIGHFGPIELEQGSQNGNPPITAAHGQLVPTTSVTIPSVNSIESQLLPGHLKCGMWASLALATVFVAVFQGTGLEVLIFCAFSALFFLAACTISMCRRPRDLLAMAQSPNIFIEHPSTTRAVQPLDPQQQQLLDLHRQNSNNPQQNSNSTQTQIVLEVPPNESAAPPPPYHIAILLPDNDKEPDESPPPSYDKLQI